MPDLDAWTRRGFGDFCVVEEGLVHLLAQFAELFVEEGLVSEGVEVLLDEVSDALCLVSGKAVEHGVGVEFGDGVVGTDADGHVE